jgi:hypothetical protein
MSKRFYVALMVLSTACSSLEYSLHDVPFPVSASPIASPPPGSERFELRSKHILWGYGLFGQTQPDVADALRSRLPCAGVADFRIQAGANFWDWLGTHLSLGLVRLKTVTMTGVKLPVRTP